MQRAKSAMVTITCMLYLSVVCSTFFGCGGGDPSESSGSTSVSTTQESISNYTTQKVVLQKIADKVRAIGTVQAYQEVPISPEISGKIKKIYFSVGDRVKQGDILAASMTTPDYVSAMKKAKAIITDEGGITCHAAIVSRELGIPCVIGTKIATKALKDGDVVEVDADKGVVKILKNN